MRLYYLLAMSIITTTSFSLATLAAAFYPPTKAPTGGVLRYSEEGPNFTTLADVVCDQYLGAFRLAKLDTMLTRVDNVLADVTCDPADEWAEIIPPEGKGKKYLRCLNTTADYGTKSLAQNDRDALVANPAVDIHLIRKPLPDGQTSVPNFTISLESSEESPLQVCSVSIDAEGACLQWRDSTTFDSASRKFAWTADESEAFGTPGSLYVSIWFAADRMFVLTSWSNAVLILSPDDVTTIGGSLHPKVIMGRCHWLVSGTDTGAFAVNVSPAGFASTGEMTTPWVEMLRDVTGETPTLALFPPLETGCTASITATEINGTKARFDLEIQADGARPCPVQAVSIAFAGDWPPFTPRAMLVPIPGVQQCDETYPEDPLQRTGRLVFDLTDGACRSSLEAYSRTYLGGTDGWRGLNAVSCGISGIHGSIRWMGVVRQVEDRNEVDQPRTVTLTIGSRASLWADMSLMCVPALWGQTLADAVGICLERLGVHPDDYNTSSAPAVTVKDPGWGYDTSPWGSMSEGQALDALRRLVDEHGAVLADRASGILYLEPKPSPPVDPSSLPLITDEVGADGAESNIALNDTAALVQAHNGVQVIGRGPDGRRLTAYRAVASSPVPFACVLQVDASDRAATQEDVDRIAEEERDRLINARREITATNPGYGWYDWWGLEYVRVTSERLGLTEAVYQIVNQEVQYVGPGMKTTPVSLVLREV